MNGEAALPPADQIRDAAATILARPEYRLDGEMYDSPWLDRIQGFFRDLFESAGELFQALYAASPILYWLLVLGLLLTAAGLMFHIVVSFRAALARRAGAGLGKVPEPATPRNPEGWEARAREAAERGDWTGAVRCLFQACLLTLFLARKERPPRGTTNRALLRRYGPTPAGPCLRVFVDTLDLTWYAGQECGRKDYDACLEAHQAIRGQRGTGGDGV